MTKPNIIFLMTDQQRWDCIGMFNKYIKTPALDSIAKEGIVFNQTTCQCPMCVPSRNSLMLGMYPSQLGVRTNAGGLFREDRLPSLPIPELMKEAGYQTAGFGKTHWNSGVLNPEPPTRGFEVRAEGQPTNSACYENGAVMMDKINPEGLTAYFNETKDYGGGEENSKGYIGRTSNLDMRDHRDGFIAERCLEFLDEDLDPDRPLFLYLSFIKPHAGFNVPKEFEDLYDVNDIPDIPQPNWLKEPETHLGNLRENYPHFKERHDDWFSVWENMSLVERRRTTLRYWANCSWLDNYFGQVLEKLKKMGILENSIIVYTSDHGDMLGERRHTFSKYCLYDSSVRVPLILSGSLIPQNKKGTIDERPAELVDLVPTLTKVAGLTRNPILPGLDLLSEEKRLGSFSEFHGGGSEALQPGPAYMWRKKGWKLILYIPGSVTDGVQRTDQAKGELYNLEEDPHEWSNLYYNNEHATIREGMKTELLMHLACVWSKGPFYYDNKGYAKLDSDIGLEAYKNNNGKK